MVNASILKPVHSIDYINGCQGKNKYASKQAADVAISRYKNWQHLDKRPLQGYKCPECSFYHFGHKYRKGTRR